MPEQMAKIDMGTSILAQLIQELGPRDFAIALSNANCHGKAFVFAGYEFALNRDDGSLLKEWQDTVDKMIDIGEKLDKIMEV